MQIHNQLVYAGFGAKNKKKNQNRRKNFLYHITESILWKCAQKQLPFKNGEHFGKKANTMLRELTQLYTKKLCE